MKTVKETIKQYIDDVQFDKALRLFEEVLQELPNTSLEELGDILSRVKRETHSYKVGVFMKVYSETQAKQLLLNVYEQGLNDVKKIKSELQLENENSLKKKKKKDKSAKRKKDSIEKIINSTSKKYHRHVFIPTMQLIISAGLVVPLFFEEKLFMHYDGFAIAITSLNLILAIWNFIVPAATIKNGQLKIHIDLGKSKTIDLHIINSYDINHRGKRIYLTMMDGSIQRIRLTSFSNFSRNEFVNFIKSIAKSAD